MTLLLSAGALHAEGDDQPHWTAPEHMALRRVGEVPDIKDTPVPFDSLDCTSLTYRTVTDPTMRTGCFSQAAFGMFDTDDQMVIFNGTDEGLPMAPYTAHQVLATWPQTMYLVSLTPVATGGVEIGLYKDLRDKLQDQRDIYGQLAGKVLAGPADMVLRDRSGKPIVINPQTLAFPDGGGWLVAETLEGSFVRIDLANLAVMPFAPAYGSQGSPGLLKSQVAASDDGRFIAIANDAADELKVYDLTTCRAPARDLVHDLPPQECRSYDYRPFIRGKVGGLRNIRHLRFVNEGLLSFEALTSDSVADGTYELAPAADIGPLTGYIGLGDSYTSGEGAFDYLPGTDTPDDTCHLSVHSYPLLLKRDIFGENGGHSVACSGAVIDDIASTDGGYRGQVKDGPSLEELRSSLPLTLESIESGFMPGYIAQQRFITRWQPAVATVSIGGNDIGFGDILRNCVGPRTCYSSYEDRLELKDLIDRTVPRWTALYARLRRASPATRLYAIGYPQVALSGGDCALNVRLDRSELELASEVIDYLDLSMKKAALKAGISYVDISDALYGHRLCEAPGNAVGMNGLTAGGDAGLLGIGLLGRESYHPNALGHELIEQAILRQTHRLTTVTSVKGSLSDFEPAMPSGLLSAPSTGRRIYGLIPDDAMTAGVATRGSRLSLKVDGSKAGLPSRTPYIVRLDGPQGVPIGLLTSGDAGKLEGAVTVPDDAAPGGHTIDVLGTSLSGLPVDITRPLYITSVAHEDDGSVGIAAVVSPGGPIGRDGTTSPGGPSAGHVSVVLSGQKDMVGRRPRPDGQNPETSGFAMAEGAASGAGRAATIAPAVLSAFLALIVLAKRFNKKRRFRLQ